MVSPSAAGRQACAGQGSYYVLRYYVRRSKVSGMPLPARDSNRQHNGASDPPLLILTSLASGPKHGYALLLDIEKFAGVRLGPGTLYGAIGRLEQRGLIEALEANGRKRPYRLTAPGAQTLEATLAELRVIVNEGKARLRRHPRPGAATVGSLA